MRTVFYLLLLLPISVNASILTFSCDGMNRGNQIANSPSNFDIKVNSETGELFNMPGYIVPGCMDFANPKPPKFSINEDRASTSCSNDYAFTIITFSRNSGKLNITSEVKGNDSRNGIWNCTAQKKKLF